MFQPVISQLFPVFNRLAPFLSMRQTTNDHLGFRMFPMVHLGQNLKFTIPLRSNNAFPEQHLFIKNHPDPLIYSNPSGGFSLNFH